MNEIHSNDFPFYFQCDKNEKVFKQTIKKQ